VAYAYYVPIVVQSGQVTGSVTDFVALLDHTFAPWKSVGNGGRINNTTGGGFPADWNVYADSALTTAIPFELVSWDATTGAIVAWIRTDVATATTVYIAYDDPAVIISPYDITATWASAGFAAVYHMDILIGGTTWIDSFGAGSAALTNTNGTLVAGKVDDAGDFNGTTAYARYNGAVVTAPPLTFSAWINPDALAGWALTAMHATGVWNGFLIALDVSPDRIGFYTVSNDFAAFGGAEQTGATTGDWQHVAGVTSGVASRFAYVNGVAGSENTTSVTPTVAPDNFVVGAATSSHGTLSFYDGIVDEVRVHNVARDGAWLEAEYHSQNDATAFWVLGSETPVGAVTGPSYYGYVGYYQ
jgi:hypothetical protein